MTSLQQEVALLACILLDFLSFICAREDLKDFLIGAIGRRKAKIEWSSNPFFKRITLIFIKKHIYKEAVLFRRFYFLYHLLIFSLAPQYIVLIIISVYFKTQLTIVLIIKFIISFLLLLTFRIPQLPHGTSKFVHYHPKGKHYRHDSERDKT